MIDQDPPIFITLGNRKGGVGKTTSVINLASCLAILGKKILIIDTDPQANCSSILLEDFNDQSTRSLIDALEAPEGEGLLSEFACNTYHPRIKIIPNTTRCMLWERKIAQNTDAVIGIRRLINQDPNLNNYDFVIFDTPPNLGVMMNNALMASDYVIIPIPPNDRFSLDGLAAYLELIASIREHNPNLKLLAVLITKYDPDWGKSRQNLNQIKKYFSQKGISIFNTIIHACPEIDMAHVERKTIFESAPKSSGAIEYSALGKELFEIFNVIYGKKFI
ncbi:MAG: ParA family protein [Thermodesulfobacteriota bacterium]|nr:ParA family protein [Thermodesulfobacteriota bacterium]